MKRILNRDSRIELLRILGMLMIIQSHFYIYGNWSGTQTLNPKNTVKILALDGLGPAGAIIFFIITGYFANLSLDFQSDLKKAKRKAFNTWKKTFTYSVVITIIFISIGVNVKLKELIIAFLPFTLGEYWFISCYMLLIIFSPFINILLSNLSNKQLKIINILLFLPQVLMLANNSCVSKFILAISGYIIGATIRIKKSEFINIKAHNYIILMLLIYAFELCSVYFSRILGTRFEHSAHFMEYVPAYIIAICIFVLFLKFPIFHSKIINLLALGSFAAYLITEQIVFRKILWTQIVNARGVQNSPYLYLFSLSTVVVIYVICSLFDLFISYLCLLIKRLFCSYFKGDRTVH
ncbi:acyltransferase [Limosilactobacillus fermentum]|uniref:acyltransferase n=1 Tax=Limosilactobacillus fermentum TaxID=1613 RepID=UPI002D77D439|nr:acyltransferase [Limosilactobacillus fermentum]WRQ23743.1 acyltransferase [Limosilactobacillus fermentum]WRQ25508.1 acyltransferase [Limosilactobacillus fermentum]